MKNTFNFNELMELCKTKNVKIYGVYEAMSQYNSPDFYYYNTHFAQNKNELLNSDEFDKLHNWLILSFHLEDIKENKQLKEDLNAYTTLELISYAREHSTQSTFNLPDGKQYSCDMGYVEEFLNIIEKSLER